MRRSTELLFMIVGCAALVVAAVLLPALLLTPPARIEQAAKAPAPTPQAEPGLSPAEPTRFPPVVQLPDPPLPRRAETITPPDQVAESPSAPMQPVGPRESTGSVDAGAPREAAKPADQTARSSDEVAAVAPSGPQDAAKSKEQTTANDANVPSDAAKPSDQVAMAAPSEGSQAAKPGERAVGSTANMSAARVPSDPATAVGADRKMPVVETPVPSDIDVVPAPGEPAGKVAGIKPDEPADTGRAPEEASTPAPRSRKSGRVRTPWWCSDPRGDDVAAVCGNQELLALDAQLNVLYSKLMAREQNSELRKAQRQWLAERQRCGADIPCLKRHYENRIDELARM